jgi:hypothetical protein
MAEDPVAPRFRAANVSRRALLGGIASTPVAAAVRIAPSTSAWQRALKAYSAAHHRHEEFLATVLRPAYARFNADVTRSSAQEDEEPSFAAQRLREKIVAAERAITALGGGRAEIVAQRASDPELARLRSMLAHNLRLLRERGRLMEEYDIFELEEQGGDLLVPKMDALRALVAIPATDWAGLLLKVRLSYEEIFRHEDYEGLLGAIFTDVERLCG